MDKFLKYGNTVRNNWKKSTLAAIAFYYGATKIKEKYEINILMSAACKEAVKYGDSLIPMERNPTMVTVILNPVANKRKAKQDYEKYCEPLLHLAGLQVEVIQTTSEGNAKEIVETLRGTEAIIVAGGDGTLSETITGLLRRNDDANQFPLGVLPLGSTNTLGNTLFPGGKGIDKVKQLIDASMAIIKGNTIWKDAMKVEPMVNEEENPSRPIYAMSSLEWGAFRDALSRKDKYWIYGPWREYATYIFNGYKQSLTWQCSGQIKYTEPCAGCTNCLKPKAEVKRKWFFMPSTAAAPQRDQTATENPECTVSHELCFKTADLRIKSPNVEKASPIPALSIALGKNNYTYQEFVSEGCKRVKGEDTSVNIIPVRTVELLPNATDNDVTIEIDKEEFELKPIKITLLPKVIKLFCRPEINNV